MENFSKRIRKIIKKERIFIMDKKNFIIGIICLFAAFTLFIQQEKQLRQNVPQQSVEISKAETSLAKETVDVSLPLPKQESFVSQLYTLENEVVKEFCCFWVLTR